MPTDSLTLLTPTGGRPDAFALCETFLARQTFTGDIQWIVIDDCDPPTPCTLNQTVLRPTPHWRPGQMTQARNLLHALPLIRHDKILHIEDDDWYSPDYLSIMSSRLDTHPFIGESHSHYYNVAVRRYRTFDNTLHSSLAQIGFRSDLLPRFKKLCSRPPGSLDIYLCRDARALLHLTPWSGIYLGIKGLPGRPGTVRGHRDTSSNSWHPDPDLAILQSWIGPDALLYSRYGGV